MPPCLVPVLGGGLSVVTATIAVIKYRMRLKFYEHVLDRNGDRLDLESAGKVIHPRWTAVSDGAARRYSSTAEDENGASAALKSSAIRRTRLRNGSPC